MCVCPACAATCWGKGNNSLPVLPVYYPLFPFLPLPFSFFMYLRSLLLSPTRHHCRPPASSSIKPNLRRRPTASSLLQPFLRRYTPSPAYSARMMATSLPRLPIFEAVAAHDPASTAVVHASSGRRFTYGELLGDVGRARDRLREARGGRDLDGERVAFLVENSYDYIGELQDEKQTDWNFKPLRVLIR